MCGRPIPLIVTVFGLIGTRSIRDCVGLQGDRDLPGWGPPHGLALESGEVARRRDFGTTYERRAIFYRPRVT